jgi:cytochrome c
MLRTWVIAGIALAASTGPTLGQDAAAGEQVFKRLCSPCHEIGQDAKIKLGPPLNGIDGRKSGTFDGFNYSPANKSSGITWSEETFPKYIRAPMQEISASRTTRTSQTSGPISSSSGLMGRRNETRRAGKRGESNSVMYAKGNPATLTRRGSPDRPI